jgi:hypothetical protein
MEKSIISKELLRSEELYVQFTAEEVQQLGLEEGQKFSIQITDDGGVMLKPHVKIEIELTDFSREVLEYIISESCERDVSVNEVISGMLENFMEYKNES